jgi:hypothetical protein
MANNLLLAQYAKLAHVKDRNYAGLVSWSAFEAAQPLPPDKPDPDWARQRIVGERVPLQPTLYTDRTLAYFLQDPTTVTNIREYLHPHNDDATEEALALQISGVISTFMPRFAAADVTDAQLSQWYTQNGWPPDPAETPSLPQLLPQRPR